MAKVNIPLDFFFNEAKKEYYNFRQRLVTELLQNSFDAGASRIEFTFTETGFSCEDNGGGMTKERMVEALLTMGGSVKTLGATGGFGAAKKLILFAHKNYAIHSRDVLATGSLLDYEIQLIPALNGTRVSAVYLDPANFPVETMVQEVKNVCERSYLAIEVLVNDVVVKERANIGEFSKHLEKDGKVFGDIYVNKSRKSSYITVMANGLFSFTSYLGYDVDAPTINITVPSKDAFSQSRDSFAGEVRDVFNAMVGDIAMNNKSWHKKRKDVQVLKGNNDFWRVAFERAAIILDKTFDELKAMAPGMLDNHNSDALMSFLMDEANWNDKGTEIDTIIEELVKPNIHNVDFYYDLADSKFDELPEKYHPKTGEQRYRRLAGLYKAILEEIAMLSEASMRFNIGFTFCDDTLAQFKEIDRRYVFMINPTKELFTKGKWRNRFFQVYAAALHEFAHRTSPNHDEIFAGELTRLTALCFQNTRGQTKLTEQAERYENNL